MRSLKGATLAVTGAAGFMGPHLMRALSRRAAEVKGVDLNRQAVGRLAPTLPSNARLTAGDATDVPAMARYFQPCGAVFHLAADPDVRHSTAHPLEHFDANVMGTLEVLEAMRKADVSRIIFPSTSTVYGDAKVVPTPEDYSPLRPISVYGASKLACEGMLSSYAASYGFDAVSLRLANAIGPGATHGVIFDLVEKLKRNPKSLEVLGDGRQRKSYLYIDDLVAGTLLAAQKAPRGFSAYNIGSKDTADVDTVARAVIRAMGLPRVKIVHKPAAGGRGWAGDIKVMQLALDQIRAIGFKPRWTSEAAVEATARAVAKERARRPAATG